MNSGLFNVHCMSCKHQWDDESIRQSLSAAAIKRLETTTKKRLVRNELEHVLDTQPYLELQNNVATKMVDEFTQISKKHSDDLHRMHTLEIRFKRTREESDELSKLRNETYDKKQSMTFLKTAINAWRYKHYVSRRLCDACPASIVEKLDRLSPTASTPAAAARLEIVCPCPSETCRGIVCTNYVCQVCDLKICHKCLTVDHSGPCRDTDVESATYVLQSSKPCPTCAARIYKIDGCSQMWCTQCHTAFDWNTLQVQKNVTIHNPHFYQWMHTQDLGDEGPRFNNCDELPDIRHLYRHLRLSFNGLDTSNFVKFHRRCSRTLRACNHVMAVEVPRWENPQLEPLDDLEHGPFEYRQLREVYSTDFMQHFDIRIKWLNKELSDQQFEGVLHRRYKARVLNARVGQTCRLMVTVCIDIFHRLLRENDMDTWESYDLQFRNIVEYADSCVDRICTVYKSKRSSRHPNFSALIDRF
jgi:hypothetical protein